MYTNNLQKHIKINNAFTLAELCIVLVVIGVIALFVLNSLSKVTPNKEKALFKKAYEVTERTVSELVNDENFYPYDPVNIGFSNMDTVTLPNGVNTTNRDKFCRLFAYKLNTVESDFTNAFNCTFTTTDGIEWSVPKTEFVSGSTITISIDVNGEEDGPNSRTTDIDRDMFRIIVASDGGVSVPQTEDGRMLHPAMPAGPHGWMPALYEQVESLEKTYLKSHEMR